MSIYHTGLGGLLTDDDGAFLAWDLDRCTVYTANVGHGRLEYSSDDPWVVGRMVRLLQRQVRAANGATSYLRLTIRRRDSARVSDQDFVLYQHGEGGCDQSGTLLPLAHRGED